MRQHHNTHLYLILVTYKTMFIKRNVSKVEHAYNRKFRDRENNKQHIIKVNMRKRLDVRAGGGGEGGGLSTPVFYQKHYLS